MAMRRFLGPSLVLLLAACATAPRAPVSQAEQPAGEAATTRSEVIGMTAPDLIHSFGSPALQIREGASLKMQFRSQLCVLDAYLYPSGNTPYRVTHVDTRTRSLAPVDQALCIASLRAP